MKWVLIDKFAESSGYTAKAIRRKIEEGVFVQGIHWRYSPDKRIHINQEAYERWVEGEPTKASKRVRTPSACNSSGVGSVAAKH